MISEVAPLEPVGPTGKLRFFSIVLKGQNGMYFVQTYCLGSEDPIYISDGNTTETVPRR